MSSADQSHAIVPFDEFLHEFKTRMHNVFHKREDIDALSTNRGLPPYVLREVLACNPLSAFIPAEYGGRGADPREGIAVVEAASYESLPLALIFGINWALFLQPVAKYGREEAKRAVLDSVQRERKMGGLMITEPDYGSDALPMQTSWSEADGLCHLRGTKHLAGLHGWADYWLLTARQKGGPRGLARDIDFFICDANAPGQRVVVEERYNNLGLYMIPYGRNRIDVRIPASRRLVPHSTGIKMMLDLLHRSRLQFPSMAMGFLTRLLDEAVAHCRDRLVGGRALLGYDQVQARLTRIQSAFTVCSAMCVATAERAGIDRDLAPHGLEANAVKTCITDLMQDAAQSLLQLCGAMGYRLDHIAGRAVVDSRPFQIFEGSNDILYAQVSEALLKLMKAARQTKLSAFLKQFELTGRASDRLLALLDFEIDPSMAQRKLVELGRAVSRIIAMDLVIRLGERGFDRQLIDASVSSLQQEVTGLLSSCACDHRAGLIDPDQGHPSWRDFCQT